MIAFLPILLVLGAIIGGVFSLTKSASSQEKQIHRLSKREKALKITSIILNLIWGILFLPVMFLSAYGTLFTWDTTGYMQTILAYIAMYLIIPTPLIVIISIISSFVFRNKLKMALSVSIQLLPIVTATIGFLLGTVSTKLG